MNVTRRGVLALSLILASSIPLNAEGQEGSVSPDQSQGAVSLSVAPAMLKARFGAPLSVTIIIANGLSQPLFYLRASPVYDFTYTIVDEHGTHVGMGGHLLPPIISLAHKQLDPQREERIPIRLDPFMAFDRPGSYTMTVSTKLNHSVPPTPTLTSNPVAIILSN